MTVTRARVAVLVACHNDGTTIRETIDSLREEPQIELVVVDDGSSDPSTLETLVELEHEGVHVLHQENQGPSAAWMKGLAATTAPYVMPFSSDDVLLRGSTGRLADVLDADAAAGFAWGDMETFGLAAAYRPSVPVLCPWLVTFANCIPAYSLFRRSLLIEVGGWQTIAASEDWDLWMRLAAHGDDGRYVPGLVYRYRRSPGGRFRRRGSHYEPYYEELRERNDSLFEARSENRRASAAPLSLKVLVPAVDALPAIPRLKKMQITEALTLLLWSAGIRRTTRIAAQGVAFRVRLLRRR